jgi:uncharacterized integral membrane protein
MTSSSRTSLLTIARERWIAIVLIVVTATFVAQNRNRVDFNLFWLHWRMPLWFVLVVIAAIGAIVGFVIARHRES